MLLLLLVSNLQHNLDKIMIAKKIDKIMIAKKIEKMLTVKIAETITRKENIRRAGRSSVTGPTSMAKSAFLEYSFIFFFLILLSL